MAEKLQIANESEFFGLRTDTPPAKCPKNYSPDCSDLVFTTGDFATRNPFRAKVTLPANVVYRKEFTCRDGSVQILALDVNGNLYTVAADGTATVIDMVAPGSVINSVTAYGREYLSFFNQATNTPTDAPRQWDGKNLYRVSNGAPGSGGTYTPNPNTGDTYPIFSITQPVQQVRGSSYFLWSAATGDNVNPGTNITIYYSDMTAGAGPDADLEAAFNSGYPVYIYVKFVDPYAPETYGPYVQLVTGIGLAQPPGQPHHFYYFTYTVPDSELHYIIASGFPDDTVTYQRSLATLTTSTPIPGVAVGNNITITGSSVPQYNSTWPVAQTPNSGSMAITQTSLTGGTATYSYTVSSGVAPVAGQTISTLGLTNGPLNPITGTSVLNVTNATIDTASGGTTGTFTIVGFPAGTYAPAAESGSGLTAGTEFLFDPGIPFLGTSSNPIYGNATGGLVIFDSNPNDITIAQGTRQAVVFFIYPDEYTTGVSAIVKFSVPSNTKSLTVDDLPIGPPAVIGRGVAFTQANGSRFFYLDIPAQVNGIPTGTSTVVMDNTSSSATFNFSDLALAGGQGIDLPGNNLFRQVALNLPRGVNWYKERLYWLGEANTVYGFQNLGMDGGTLSGSTVPLGWTPADVGSIQQVGIMPTYVVTGPHTGELDQPAAKDSAGNALIQPKLNYTLRFWTTDGATGLLQASLSSASTAFSSVATFDMSTATLNAYQTISFPLSMPATIPDDLTLSVKFLGLTGTAKIRDLQLIYADNPNRNPVARASYVVNPEAYDSLTGNIGPNDDNTELRAIFVLQESLHFLTERRLYDVQEIGNSEPSSWDPNQVSDKCGCFNSNAVTTGKGWAAWGGLDGGQLYTGGIPQKTSATIKGTWANVANITNMLDDSISERVYMGIIAPNGTKSMLVYDYHEVPLGGTWKWCPWNRPLNWVSSSASGTVFNFGAKLYQLDTSAGVSDDDLGPISGYYIFAAFGLSMFKKQYNYLGLRITGQGPMTPFLYPKTLQDAPFPLSAFNVQDMLDTVVEWPTLTLSGRLMFLKLGQPGVQFSCEDVTCLYQGDPNQPIAGVR